MVSAAWVDTLDFAGAIAGSQESDSTKCAAVQYQPRVLEYPAFADSFAKALADAEAGAAPSKRDTGSSGKAAALRKVWSNLEREECRMFLLLLSAEPWKALCTVTMRLPSVSLRLFPSNHTGGA